MRTTPIHKAFLEAGAQLEHTYLGVVTYTAQCKELDSRDGNPATLFVQHGTEVKEVTLALLDFIS
jgi:hypothetical protein